ncbi:sensor histidine kinase [Clostridium sp. JNZ X4-2]
MEYIWVITTFLLIFMFIILVFYHLYYHMNIKHITRQLKEIMNTDTNQLLTVTAKQRDITEMVNQLNNLIRDVRVSRIGIKRLNRNFRQSIINISHDLRTPLTTASGYVQMLQADAADEEQQEYLAIVLERQNMVKTLLKQLFEYVRIESGEITYEHVPMNAKKVLMDTLVMYYDDFYKKGEEPTVHFPEKSCMIRGDEQGVKRIFSNILFNAVIHGRGEYCFEIQESKESSSYMFTFSNLSEPMTRDDLDCIFERFYTQDKSRNKKTTGLGLTIAREITRQLNGTIEAFYNNGKFSISIVFPKV